MKKRLGTCISITLCAALLLGLAGCGGGGETQQGSTDETYELTWAGISSTEAIDTCIPEISLALPRLLLGAKLAI